jgi:hypothetical protein
VSFPELFDLDFVQRIAFIDSQPLASAGPRNIRRAMRPTRNGCLSA